MAEFGERQSERGSQNRSNGGLSEQIFGDGRNSKDNHRYEEQRTLYRNDLRQGNNLRPLVQNIIGQVVNDLIIQGGQRQFPGGYSPRFQPGFNPGVDPRYQPRHEPRYQPGFDPRCQPGFDPRYQPGFDPRYQPGFDPRYQPGFDPRYQPGFDPRYQPGFDPRYQPGFDPRYQPGFDPRYQPGNGPRYQPDFDPRFNPPVFQPGGFNPNGPLRNLIRQSINDFRNNPQAIEGLLNNLGSLSQDMRFNVDRERREISLGMDFTKAYDMLGRQQGMPENPELRRVLAGLDSIQANPDALALNWKSEQLIALDQPNGPKDLRLLLGGGTNRTTLNIETSETSVRLSNIQGLEAVDPSGRRMKIHGVDIDSSNPQEPKGTITIDNPIPRPAQLPPGTPWPEQVGLPIPITTDNQKQAVPRLVSKLHNARTAVINGDLGAIISSVNPQEMSTLLEMLKPPQAPPIPDPPRPGILPDTPQPPPVPGVLEVEPIPGYEPQVPARPSSDSHPVQPEVTTRPSKELVDYFDIIPSSPKPAPGPETTQTVLPDVTPSEIQPIQPNHSRQTEEPSHAPLPPSKSSSPWDLPTSNVKPGLSSSINLFRPQEALPKSTRAPIVTPPLAVTEVPKPQSLETKTAPAESSAKLDESLPQQRETVKPGGGRSSDLLRERGIKVTAAEKIGPDKLFSMIFADADQRGPLVTGFKGRIQDVQFRKDLDAVGKTINRFDVDKQNKAITVGLDFGKVYDTFEEAGKHKPETRQFLQGLQSLTVSPSQLRLNFDGPRKLAMDGDGLKKADLWMGMSNNQTTFDIQTTENMLAMKNIRGLQAEVQALGKKLNVYEVMIDNSTGTPTATALVDNPFAKPPGVSDDLWQSTMSIPLELGKTQDEQVQVAQRLPQTLRSLHAMRQGALSGDMAERIGNLTKEEIIELLKFQ